MNLGHRRQDSGVRWLPAIGCSVDAALLFVALRKLKMGWPNFASACKGACLRLHRYSKVSSSHCPMSGQSEVRSYMLGASVQHPTVSMQERHRGCITIVIHLLPNWPRSNT